MSLRPTLRAILPRSSTVSENKRAHTLSVFSNLYTLDVPNDIRCPARFDSANGKKTLAIGAPKLNAFLVAQALFFAVKVRSSLEHHGGFASINAGSGTELLF